MNLPSTCPHTSCRLHDDFARHSTHSNKNEPMASIPDDYHVEWWTELVSVDSFAFSNQLHRHVSELSWETLTKMQSLNWRDSLTLDYHSVFALVNCYDSGISRRQRWTTVVRENKSITCCNTKFMQRHRKIWGKSRMNWCYWNELLLSTQNLQKAKKSTKCCQDYPDIHSALSDVIG